jgi:coproporphyrinogen III oxidase
LILLSLTSLCIFRPAEKILEFSKEAVNNVVEAYCPIVKKHMNDKFTEEQKQWQQIRRGR